MSVLICDFCGGLRTDEHVKAFGEYLCCSDCLERAVKRLNPPKRKLPPAARGKPQTGEKEKR